MILVPLMPDDDKTLSGSQVLKMRICWRHVNTIKNVSQVYFVVEELNPGIPGFSSSITQAKVCCEEERSRD